MSLSATKASFVALVARLRSAFEELESMGLLSGLQVNLVEGPEEYLFGEEKALLNVIDGEGPFPREDKRAHTSFSARECGREL